MKKQEFNNGELKEARLIVQVKQAKSGHKSVTIPKSYNIEEGEYVEITKVFL